MKNFILKFTAVFCLIAFSFCFAGCIKGDDAKKLTKDFLEAIDDEDYEKGETYLHPNYNLNIKKEIEEIEARKNVDFSNGVEIDKYHGFSSTLYASEVDGSEFELDFTIIVDGKRLEAHISIVDNDDGYGIYYFEIH